METCLLLLIPHRDCHRALWDYRRRLFAAGAAGAYSFPLGAPLAALPRPLTAGELRILAGALRELSLPAGGWFRASGEAETLPLPGEGLLLAGPALSPSPGEAFAAAFAAAFAGLESGARPLERALLPGALLAPGETLPEERPPETAFRAARLANCLLRPLAGGELSFSWIIDPGRWLPRKRRRTPESLERPRGL